MRSARTGIRYAAPVAVLAGLLLLPGCAATTTTGPTAARPPEPPAGGPGTLRIDSEGSTVLFNVIDADGAPSTSGAVGLELRPGEPTAAAQVSLVPKRCDPRPLAEDKVGTLFVFVADVEGGRSGSLSLPASPELRRDLYDYFTRACGL